MSILDNPKFPLDPTDQETLLSEQHECALIWSTRDGLPIGTMMTYLWRDGKIWMTCCGHRPRVAAVRRDDRVCVIVTRQAPGNASFAVTIKGRCRVHEDIVTKQWFWTSSRTWLFRIAKMRGKECSICCRHLIALYSL